MIACAPTSTRLHTSHTSHLHPKQPPPFVHTSHPCQPLTPSIFVCGSPNQSGPLGKLWGKRSDYSYNTPYAVQSEHHPLISAQSSPRRQIMPPTLANLQTPWLSSHRARLEVPASSASVFLDHHMHLFFNSTSDYEHSYEVPVCSPPHLRPPFHLIVLWPINRCSPPAISQSSRLPGIMQSSTRDGGCMVLCFHLFTPDEEFTLLSESRLMVGTDRLPYDPSLFNYNTYPPNRIGLFSIPPSTRPWTWPMRNTSHSELWPSIEMLDKAVSREHGAKPKADNELRSSTSSVVLLSQTCLNADAGCN